jgi:sugar (pentulose or hexulose) kinase
MPVVVSVDGGSTGFAAVAVDAVTGELLTSMTLPNETETTSAADRKLGRSEWDMTAMAALARRCLRELADRLGDRARDVVGIGLTGQQHGIVIVDRDRKPLTPFIGWQDRRGDEPCPGTDLTWARRAARLVGPESRHRTGCRLATGYAVVTLFWLGETGTQPAHGTACFLTDYLAATLTGERPVTDWTMAASGGALDLRARDWDADILAALGLSRPGLVDVRPSGERLGALTTAAAGETGLPAGTPVFNGIGDNQASFLGSVADHRHTALVNVGTGGQVAVRTDEPVTDDEVEARPFPDGGYLAVAASLCGGRSYAALEGFFRQAAGQVFGLDPGRLFEPLNRLAAGLAAEAPAGADGLRCEPWFYGTRQREDLRASITGATASNFTPGHLARAVLEGIARSLRGGYAGLLRHRGPARTLVGAGNGLRENPLLADLVAAEFGLPLMRPAHREEAAYGAALLAAVGAGVQPDLATAGRLIRYRSPAC